MIETAKRTLFEGNAVAASDVPFRRRKGQFKNKHNVEDILFVLHKHPAGLPAFAVYDLSSLPPLHTKNVDFAHLLGEMHAIRAEMANLRETVAKLSKKEVPSPLAPLIDSAKPHQLPLIGRQMLTTDSPQCNGIATYRYTNKSTTDSILEQAAGSRPVSTVAAIRSSGRDHPARNDDGFTLVKKRTRPPALKTKAVIDTMGNSTVKAKTGRYVAVFVSRLLPETTAEDMEAFVQETHHLSSKCMKLESKHQSYASFKVEVTCDNVPDIYDPNCDILCLETMLTKQECSVLNSFHDNYYGYVVAPVDETLGVIRGRPHGGVGVLWKKHLDGCVSIIESEYDWLCCVRISEDILKEYYLINVYLPYECTDNTD